MADDRNPAEFFDSLRRSSAKLLKLDYDSLSAAQSVRVDRVAALRLMLDRMQSQQLSGGEIDAKSFIAASSELERLLGGSPNEATTRFASGEARERLRSLIQKTVFGDDDPDDPDADERSLAADPAGSRRKFEARLAAACAKFAPEAVAAPEPAALVSLDAEAAGEVAADESDAPAGTPAPAPRAETDVEKMDRVNAVRPPEHYLSNPWGSPYG